MSAGILIRPIREDEGPLLRRLRLRALRDSPDAFCTDVRRAEAMPAEEWAERARRAAAGEGWGIFLAEAGGVPCGMAAGIPDPARPGVVELVQMWVDPAWRRKSIGRGLVEAVTDWSARRGLRVRLGVAEDQPAAVVLYERTGFVPTGESEPHPGRPDVLIRWLERA